MGRVARGVGALARIAASLALVSALAAPGTAAQQTVRLSKQLSLDYVIADGRLRTCNLHASTGDPSVDEAICQLLESCVLEGAKTQDKAMACLAPRYNRLAQLVGAGLLTTIGDTPDGDDDAAPETKQGDDIVVTGARLPRPGLWLITERGTRIMAAQDNMMFTLPTRTWRRCIEPDAVATAIADMMRFNPGGDLRGKPQGPCGWTVTAGDATLTGKQMCAIRGGMLKGTMKGAFNASRFQVEKDVRYHQLMLPTAFQQHQRAVMEGFGETVAGPEDEAYPRLPQSDMDRIPKEVRDNLQDNSDTVTVVGVRVGACPRTAS